MRLSTWLALGTLLVNLLGPASAGESIAVVMAAATAGDPLSVEQLRLIYKRKAQINALGQRWIPVNLPIESPLRRGFSQALFDTSPEAMENFWNAQYFQGISPPDVLASEEAVLRFVAVTPGAIGYVRVAAADDRVKVLLILPGGRDKH